MSYLHVVALSTSRDSTGHGRQDIFHQQELREQDNARQEPGAQSVRMGICCLYTALQTTEAAEALPANIKSLKTVLLDVSAPRDGSPGLLENASAKVQYTWSRKSLWTGFADGHNSRNS